MDVDKETSSLEIVRSSKFWFGDGSVVLQAEHTQFCVHQSLLCRQSAVLNDLFTVPQPQDRESVEGRPLVRLVDNAADWENILECLYNGLMLRSEMKGNFPRCLVSMLRLGDKYLLDEIKSFAVRHLKEEFPTSFPQFTALMPRFRTTRHLGYEIDFINIALELQMTSLLPVLFYEFLKNRPLNEIFDGTARTDGTVAVLDQLTQRRLTIGRHKLLTAVMHHPLQWVFTSDFEESTCCVQQRHDFLQTNAASSFRDVSYTLDVSGMQSEVKYGKFCPACSTSANLAIGVGCRAVWEELPSYFDLPTWQVLNQNPVGVV